MHGRAQEDFSQWGVSAVSVVPNTPLVERVFRQGCDQITAPRPSASERWANTRRSIPPVACLGVGADQRGFVWRGTSTGWFNYHTLGQMGHRLVCRQTDKQEKFSSQTRLITSNEVGPVGINMSCLAERVSVQTSQKTLFPDIWSHSSAESRCLLLYDIFLFPPLHEAA